MEDLREALRQSSELCELGVMACLLVWIAFVTSKTGETIENETPSSNLLLPRRSILCNSFSAGSSAVFDHGHSMDRNTCAIEGRRSHIGWLSACST